MSSEDLSHSDSESKDDSRPTPSLYVSHISFVLDQPKVPFKTGPELRRMRTQEVVKALGTIGVIVSGPIDNQEREYALFDYLRHMAPPPIPRHIPTDRYSRLQIQELSHLVSQYVIDPAIWAYVFHYLLNRLRDLGVLRLHFDYNSGTLEVYQQLVELIGGTTFQAFLDKWDTAEQPLSESDFWNFGEILEFTQEFSTERLEDYGSEGPDLIDYVLTYLGRRDGFMGPKETLNGFLYRMEQRTE